MRGARDFYDWERRASLDNPFALFATALKALREAYGISQADLAAELDCSVVSVALWETHRTLPDAVNTLKIIAATFKAIADGLIDPRDTLVGNILLSGIIGASQIPTVSALIKQLGEVVDVRDSRGGPVLAGAAH